MNFLYNTQHDCLFANCTASGKRPIMQERVESALFETHIEHQPVERFVINTHAFHNAHLLRNTLPHHLVAPIPLLQDRKAKHNELAQRLQAARTVKQTANKVRAEQKKNNSAIIKRPRLDIEVEEEEEREEVL